MEIEKQIENLRLIITEIIPECYKAELIDGIVLMDCLLGVRESIYTLRDLLLTGKF